MSDGGGLPNGAGADEAASAGIFARYRGAATWVKIAIPVAILAVLVGLGAIIANALSDDSTTASGSTTTAAGNGTTALLLVATAGQLASDEASTATTTTIPESTTTIPEPTTTIPEPTTATTTAPVTTTTVAPTTIPATTAPTVAPTEPTTAPPDTTTPTTEKATTTTEKATTTTEEATTTTEEATTTTEEATTTTTEKSTTTTSVFPLPPGQVAASADAFMDAWNAIAPASGVATISRWTEKPLVGHEANVATLGGNLRIVVLTDDGSANSPVSIAVLAWLPLSNPADQAAQNEAFQQAFGVLMKTVSATVTSEQEATVAQQLGLSAATPPFPDGTTARATFDQKDYQLQALIPAGQSGVYSLVGVSAAP